MSLRSLIVWPEKIERVGLPPRLNVRCQMPKLTARLTCYSGERWAKRCRRRLQVKVSRGIYNNRVSTIYNWRRLQNAFAPFFIWVYSFWKVKNIGGTVASARCKKAEGSVPTSGLHTLVWTWHVLLVIVCVCIGGLGEGFQESDQRHAKLRLSGNSNLWTKTKLFTLTLAAGICTSASTTLSAAHVVIRSGYQYQVGIGIGSTLSCWGQFFSFSFVLVCTSAAETKGTIGQNFNDVSDLNMDCYREYWPGI